MAEGNARAQKCDEENGNGKELGGGVEEKDIDREKEKKVKEDVVIENGNMERVENSYSRFDDKMVVEKRWPRNFMDLDEWPPYPWSLENAEEEALWRWDSNPYWDIELMQGGQTYDEGEEIIWEDDVWHLRDIKEVPMKPSN